MILLKRLVRNAVENLFILPSLIISSKIKDLTKQPYLQKLLKEQTVVLILKFFQTYLPCKENIVCNPFQKKSYVEVGFL